MVHSKEKMKADVSKQMKKEELPDVGNCAKWQTRPDSG